MSRVSTFALAGVTALVMGSGALAADLAAAPYQPMATGGWYLRGYIGQSNQFVNGISHPSFATAPQFTFFDKGGFDSAPFFGAGVGYQWNSWFRTDVTGEYRGKASFHALDSYYDNSAPGYRTNDYTASKSEWVALANAYIDLGTWWSITPFIGAGVGVAFNTIEHFRDTNVIAGGGGWADTGTQTSLAWALHAGASYRASQNFAVELSYRYLNVGNGRSGLLQNLDPSFSSGNPLAPMTFHNIQSHDLMLGLRWLLQPEPMYSPALIRKG
jgi:opacity protein-like surface antigen